MLVGESERARTSFNVSHSAANGQIGGRLYFGSQALPPLCPVAIPCGKGGGLAKSRGMSASGPWCCAHGEVLGGFCEGESPSSALALWGPTFEAEFLLGPTPGVSPGCLPFPCGTRLPPRPDPFGSAPGLARGGASHGRRSYALDEVGCHEL